MNLQEPSRMSKNCPLPAKLWPSGTRPVGRYETQEQPRWWALVGGRGHSKLPARNGVPKAAVGWEVAREGPGVCRG